VALKKVHDLKPLKKNRRQLCASLAPTPRLWLHKFRCADNNLGTLVCHCFYLALTAPFSLHTLTTIYFDVAGLIAFTMIPTSLQNDVLRSLADSNCCTVPDTVTLEPLSFSAAATRD